MTFFPLSIFGAIVYLIVKLMNQRKATVETPAEAETAEASGKKLKEDSEKKEDG